MDNEYDRRLDESWATQQVQKLLDQGYSDFHVLLNQAEGMSPFVLKNALDALDYPIDFSQYSLSNGASRSEIVDRLPIQHPLDSSWRFTRESSMQLLNHCVPKHNRPTLLIGCPSIAVNATENLTSGDITLADIDGWTLSEVEKITSQINCIELDVFKDRIPGGMYTAAILDPPWYPVEMNAFMFAASRVVVCGGTIVVVVPPRGVRRTAESEVHAIIAGAVNYGLDLHEYLRDAVSYYTPFFEKQALRAANLLRVPPEWRKGDLLVFRRNDKPVNQVPPQQTQPYRQWSELRVESCRVRFASQPTSGVSGELESILPGDILPDISRRNPYAARASVWTSGNRIFSSSDPDSLRLALSCVINGKPVKATPSLAQAVQELHQVMHIEVEEVAAQ